MDPRWQPHLEHPPAAAPITAEARGLFAAGWHADAQECRIVNLLTQVHELVAPDTWRAMREMNACVPPQLLPA